MARRRPARVVAALIAVCGLAALGTVLRRRGDAVALSFDATPPADVGDDAAPDAAPASSPVKIVVTNEYGGQPASVSRGAYGGTFAAVVEPHRDSTLTATGGGDGASYAWSVRDATAGVDEASAELAGSEWTYTFSAPAHVYLVTATDVESGSSTVLRVACKYVRREMRSLTKKDRDAYLDALAIIYKTRHADGQRTFGSNFTGGEWFIRRRAGRCPPARSRRGSRRFRSRASCSRRRACRASA